MTTTSPITYPGIDHLVDHLNQLAEAQAWFVVWHDQDVPVLYHRHSITQVEQQLIEQHAPGITTAADDGQPKRKHVIALHVYQPGQTPQVMRSTLPVCNGQHVGLDGESIWDIASAINTRRPSDHVPVVRVHEGQTAELGHVTCARLSDSEVIIRIDTTGKLPQWNDRLVVIAPRMARHGIRLRLRDITRLELRSLPAGSDTPQRGGR